MSQDQEYNSENAERLTVPQVKKKLLSVSYVRRELGEMGLLEAAVADEDFVL